MEPRLIQKKCWNQGYQQIKEMNIKRGYIQFQMDSISSY